MYKNAWCTCRFVVLPVQPFAFLTFSLSSLSWHLKVSYSPWNLKLLANDKIIASCQTKLSPKHIISNVTNFKNEFWKSVRRTRSQKQQLLPFWSSSVLPIRASFCIGCVIYTFLECFKRLFYCFTDVAGEKSRHFVTPPLGSVSDWSCRVGNLLQPIKSTTQV